MDDRTASACPPCHLGGARLEGTALGHLARALDSTWYIVDEHHLEKNFRFRDFSAALDFTNAVGRLAEKEGHHPDIHLSWGRVRLEIWTHKSGGLTESDFRLAVAIDRMPSIPVLPV